MRIADSERAGNEPCSPTAWEVLLFCPLHSKHLLMGLGKGQIWANVGHVGGASWQGWTRGLLPGAAERC